MTPDRAAPELKNCLRCGSADVRFVGPEIFCYGCGIYYGSHSGLPFALTIEMSRLLTEIVKRSYAMPHDKNGKVVEVGQVVKIDFKVTAVQRGEDYCNVTLETLDRMYPGDHKSSFTANAKQVEVVTGADWR